MDFLDDLKDLVGDVAGLAKDGVDAWGDIFGSTNDAGSNPTVILQPTVQPPTYNPNLGAGSFGFTPNWNLIVIGLVLVGVVYVIKK